MKPNSNHFTLTASEFDWTVSAGKTVRAWGFNGQLPGPRLVARKGEEITVLVKNELPEPTIIHWHGIRLPAAMDGTGEVQRPIAPGETFEYRFIVPDAGTFWYHSHYNETVQMERGMYGSLIVEDESDPVTDGEQVFLIDDMKLDRNSGFRQPGWCMPKFAERHDGRQGDTLLINGKEDPEIALHAGQVERWRFISASSARYFELHLEGRPFRIIGTDGGLLERPFETDRVLIVPGERMDILVGPFAEGEAFALESLPYNRRTFVKTRRERFATVTVGTAKPSVAVTPELLRTIEPLASRDAAVTRQVSLSVKASLKTGMDFTVNRQVHGTDQPVMVGDLQVWEVSNTSGMDHPFHLHGFFFQVLEENGREPAYRAWKDTWNLPPKSTVKIAWMPDNRPGMWMYHCHILEHHEAGMMANFQVVDPANPRPALPRKSHSCQAH